MRTMMAALIVIFTVQSAEACSRHRGGKPFWTRVYAVEAIACDPVSRRCIRSWRNFTNPVWR